jgi:hypothetical protein
MSATFAVFTTARNTFADGVNGPGDITAFATHQLESL